MKMKTFYIDIDVNNETGMDAISLVEFPAVEKNFLCFQKEQPIKLNFDSEKRIITGVALLANVPIYRNDSVYGEHYVVFTPEVIMKCVEKYSKNNLFNSVNLQHDNDNFMKNIYLTESYIIDRTRGIIPVEFNDIPDGSWIVSFKVENEELWNEIKEGKKLNGFSIQGLFTYKEKEEDIKEPTFDEWITEFLDKNN